MPDPVEILLTEQERLVVTKREEAIQEAVRRRSEAFVFIAEMHGHYTGSLDYRDGKLYVTPPLTESPAKDSNHR